jgi:hypothetical protein
LPQTTVLVGNHSTLWRWLLPDWSSDRSPSARDIAKAAAEMGVPYTLVTGIVLPDQFIENVLATPQTVMGSEKFERFDATFRGRGRHTVGRAGGTDGSGSDLGGSHQRSAELPGPVPGRGFSARHGPRSFRTACSGPSPRTTMPRMMKVPQPWPTYTKCPSMKPNTDANVNLFERAPARSSPAASTRRCAPSGPWAARRAL